jgi:CHAT domain-containing protein/Tfp pilus assembly protein PilF
MPCTAGIRKSVLEPGRTPWHLTLIMWSGLFAVAIFWLGCTVHQNPQAALERATRTFQQGDLVRAQTEAEKGHEDYSRLGSDWAWSFTILEANALLWEGKGDRALNVLISEPSPPASGDLAVQRLRLEGLAFNSSNRFSDGEQSLSEAERLCRGSEYSSCALVVSARGGQEMDRGRFVQAQRLFEQVLVSARARGDRFLEASALMNLCWSADEQARFDNVIDLCGSALQISTALGFRFIEEAVSGSLGWAYYRLGEPEKAKALFLEAGNQAETLGGNADRIKWLTNAGYVEMDTHDFKAAEKSFVDSLALARTLNGREVTINSLIALASVSEQTDKLNDAKRYADEVLARAREDDNGRDQVYGRLVQGRIAVRLHDNATAEKTFLEVAQSPDCPVFLKWEAERSLARLYEDENQRASAESEYRAALNTFETARSELKHEDSRLPFLSNASRIYDDYVHFLVIQGKSIEALRVADYSRGRTLNEGLGLLQKNETSFKPAALDAPAVARRAGGVILFYWLGEKQSYLWGITPQKASLFSLPPGAEIDAAVARYRESLAGPQDVLASADRDGQSLYRTLVAPAQALLKKTAKVFIIPDGSLNNLNFETLLVSGAKPSDPKLHYWIEDVTIANASSLRVLAAAHRDKEKRGRNLLLVGNSVAPNDKYPQLPRAEDQMNSVARRFPAAEEKILTQQAATPPAYLASNPERFSYIHFVAHGMASRLSPLDSAIVLSKSSAEDDSFKLYARDIIGHPIRAELVTISACYSSGERAYSGEGLVGLSWAFLRAGAHNVIAALWEATDNSTEQLMDKFYDELQKGKAPDAALRNAKLSLLHNSAFYNPHYWAPFQLYARLG